MACTNFRRREARLAWFLSRRPSGPGMCAQHCWHALGGPACPPRWGASSANVVYAKVKASGRWFTGDPPRGALVLWKYGKYGHAALSMGNGKIATTDPTNRPGGVGIESINYPRKWGASNSRRIWTDEYNGVRFDVEGTEIPAGDVYLSRLGFGTLDSDSVRRLQQVLNGHSLEGGSTLPTSGNYLTKTDVEVRLCQAQHGFGEDPEGESFVGPKQAEHLFAGTGNRIIDDIEPEVPTDPDKPVEPERPPTPEAGPFIDYHYGRKPKEPQSIGTSYSRIDRSAYTPPGDGFLLAMQYVNAKHSFKSGVDAAGFRLRAARADIGKGVDYTGYGDYTPNRNLTQPGVFVATHVWFEKCEGGREIHWECDRSSAFSSFDLDTRYTKYLWISKQVFDLLEGLLGGAEEVASLLTDLLEEGE